MRTVVDLQMYADFDIMGLNKSVFNKINIHCNGVYGDKNSAMNRFCENYSKLSTNKR